MKNKAEKDLTAIETTEKKSHFWKSSLSFVLEIVKTVIISLAIILPIRYFIIQPFMVDGASMEPNFFDNEYLIINEISYRFTEPQRGDVIVFKNPENETQFFIKRVIALPKETIKIEEGDIYIRTQGEENFIKINESDYLPEITKTFGNIKEIKLTNDEYFVLGDNRKNSKDSRIIGPIKENLIMGKAWIRGFPIDRISVFKTNYNYGF